MSWVLVFPLLKTIDTLFLAISKFRSFLNIRGSGFSNVGEDGMVLGTIKDSVISIMSLDNAGSEGLDLALYWVIITALVNPTAGIMESPEGILVNRVPPLMDFLFFIMAIIDAPFIYPIRLLLFPHGPSSVKSNSQV